jgi:signal transduction histidine kinase/ActR/RegA family two-component response regulator
MRLESPALLMPDADPTRAAPDDAELSRLIRAERIRMLFAPTLPVAVASDVAAIGLALLLAREVGGLPALLWAMLCVAASVVRLAHLKRYMGASDRGHPRWLRGLTLVCAVHGFTWGLAGLAMPPGDLITTAVIAATLVGACAVCTLALQADLRANLAINVPMLAPAVIMLLSRWDAYGWFGGIGLAGMLTLMVFEGRRAERRISELLWLRFTTDRIARERAEALKLAQRHSAVKDQFLATMSHEMRTPLHGILGLSRLVQGRLPDKAGAPRETRHQVALIERTGEHLLGIINDVLDFSRIEAGKLTIERAPFDLQGLLRDALALQNVAATDKGLKLRVEVTLPEPCWVHGDAARLRQILHNLVGNAVKFTDHGEVSLRVWRMPGHSPARAHDVILEVTDTGPGISATHLPLVFDAFHQVDGSFGRRHKGTGLGLTISREIARAMGGDIVADSALGQGSQFTLAVPLPPAPVGRVDLSLPDPLDADAVPARPGAAARHSRPMGLSTSDPEALLHSDLEGEPAPATLGHVLLAEDNPVNALVAEATLSNLGLAVTRVDDGEQALRQLCRIDRNFDLVLMDCQMPMLDGLEATRRLRLWEQDQGQAPITVIALTANALNGDRERCLAAGMDEHLAKPFRQDELVAVLRPHLRLKPYSTV